MKSYSGRRVRICEFTGNLDYHTEMEKKPTDKTGLLLEIDVRNEHVMIEDEGGNIIKLFYKLVKFI